MKAISRIDRKRDSRLFLGMILILLLIAVGSTPNQAKAWKPLTHVYLAEVALADAIDNGKVTICKVNYVEGTVVIRNDGSCEPLGEYSVSPEILVALQSHPSQFRAGVLGPDAYPDLVTGQQLIHVDGSKNGGSGPRTNAWLNHLWESSRRPPNNTPAIRAFVLGYLVHAAGDMYGHTFVNRFSGGEFELGENAVKHIVLEGYIGQRTPSPQSYAISIFGVQDFIYREMVFARPGSILADELYRGPGIEYSLPKKFSDLRNGLQRDVNKYHAKIVDYDRRIDGHKDKVEKCTERRIETNYKEVWKQKYDWLGFFVGWVVDTVVEVVEVVIVDPVCKGVWEAKVATAELEKQSYIGVTNGPVARYKESWIADIDDGLRAWPNTSHRIAKALVYNPNGADFKEAQEAADTYLEDHFLSMAGAPDIAIDFFVPIKKILETIPDLKELIEEYKKDILNAMFKSATGMSVDEVKGYFTSPEIYFDQVMNQGRGTHTTLRDTNRRLGLSDAGFPPPEAPVARFDYREFPAAYNTVVMTKLILIQPSEINRLLRDLGATKQISLDKNAMLGFIRTLDGGDEWHNHPQKMIFAGEEYVYQQIFLPVFPLELIASPEGDTTHPNFEQFVDQLIVNEGDVITKLLSVSGGGSEVLSYTLERAPAFVALNDREDGTADLILTPGYFDSGKHSALIHLKLGNAVFKREISVSVENVNRPPKFEPIDSITIDENSVNEIVIRASDPDEQLVTFSISQASVDFMTLEDNQDGTANLMLSPDYEQSGIYSVVLTATDPEGANVFHDVAITVNNVNRAPVFDPVDTLITKEGVQTNYLLYVTDPDRQPVALSVIALPRFASFFDYGNDSGLLSISPGYRDRGIFEVVILATDPEGATVSQTIITHVQNELQPVHTTFTDQPFKGDIGVIELQIDNLLPNLSTQLQILTPNGWKDVLNDELNTAWFHQIVGLEDAIRYAYGANAIGGSYRWVIHDKSEAHDEGWAMSDPFNIDKYQRHIVVSISLID